MTQSESIVDNLAQLAEYDWTIFLTSMFCSCSIRWMSLIDILLRASPIASLIAFFSASVILNLLSVPVWNQSWWQTSNLRHQPNMFKVSVFQPSPRSMHSHHKSKKTKTVIFATLSVGLPAHPLPYEERRPASRHRTTLGEKPRNLWCYSAR